MTPQFKVEKCHIRNDFLQNILHWFKKNLNGLLGFYPTTQKTPFLYDFVIFVKTKCWIVYMKRITFPTHEICNKSVVEKPNVITQLALGGQQQQELVALKIFVDK